jgi:hypothetical protein
MLKLDFDPSLKIERRFTKEKKTKIANGIWTLEL